MDLLRVPSVTAVSGQTRSSNSFFVRISPGLSTRQRRTSQVFGLRATASSSTQSRSATRSRTIEWGAWPLIMEAADITVNEELQSRSRGSPAGRDDPLATVLRRLSFSFPGP